MNEKEWWEEEAESIAANHGYGLHDFIVKTIAEAQRLERERIRGIVKDVEAVNDSNGRYNACMEILSKLSNE